MSIFLIDENHDVLLSSCCFFGTEKKKRVGISSLTTNKQTNKEKKTGKYEANEKEKTRT